LLKIRVQLVSGSIFDRDTDKKYYISKCIIIRIPYFHNCSHIGQKPNIIVLSPICWNWQCVDKYYAISPCFTKRNPKSEINEIQYKITVNYVTFGALWSRYVYVVAVEYDRYDIIKYCPVDLSKRKYLPCEYFKCMRNWII